MKTLFEGARSVVLAAGDFVREQMGQVTAAAIERKYINNLVSYVDKESERRLVEGLGQLLPESGFVAEEGTGAGTADKEWRWIIDPLDGTTNFLHGIPFFAISVALQHKGRTCMALVLEVCRGELFHAYEDGGGAFCNDRLIQVSRNEQLEDAFLSTGFPYYDFQYVHSYVQLLGKLMPTTRGIRRVGAAALDLAYVADGRYDLFFEQSLSPWDVAAGAYLVQQAGGIVTDFSGGDNYLFGGEIVAGNRSIYTQLAQQIRAGYTA